MQGCLQNILFSPGPKADPRVARAAHTGRGASSGAWGVRFNLFATKVPWVAKRSGCAKRDPVCRRVAWGVRALGVSREARARPNGCLEGGDPRTRFGTEQALAPEQGAAYGAHWCPADSRARRRSRGSAHCLVYDQPGCAPVCAADSPARRGRTRSGRVSTRSGGSVARARATHKLVGLMPCASTNLFAQALLWVTD